MEFWESQHRTRPFSLWVDLLFAVEKLTFWTSKVWYIFSKTHNLSQWSSQGGVSGVFLPISLAETSSNEEISGTGMTQGAQPPKKVIPPKVEQLAPEKCWDWQFDPFRNWVSVTFQGAFCCETSGGFIEPRCCFQVSGLRWGQRGIHEDKVAGIPRFFFPTTKLYT